MEIDDSTAIYDELGNVLVMLNSSASSVWERCDGTMTVDDIVEDLSRRYSAGETDLRQDVWLTLRKLGDLGLLDDARRR